MSYAPDLVQRLVRGLNLTTDDAELLAVRTVPVLILDDLVQVPATDVPLVRPAIGTQLLAAVATDREHIQLFNPSGTLVQLEDIDITVSITVAGEVQIRVHDTALTNNVTTLAFRDRRLRGAPAALIRDVSQAAAAGSVVGRQRVLADTPFTFHFDGILESGRGLLVVSEAVNVGISAIFTWKERDRYLG